MSLDVSMIVREILRRYRLPVRGHHGVTHWARVLDNGLRLAPQTGADVAVVTLFALFHDAARVNEHQDHGHGQRGAELAALWRGKLFNFEDAAFELFFTACAHHEKGLTSPNATVGTCWDADRLDLGRVGTSPDPRLLSTLAAKNPAVIAWAYQRAEVQFEPESIARTWGVGKTRTWWSWLSSW